MNNLVSWLSRSLSGIKIKGLGKKSQESLQAGGVNCVADLVRLLPRDYNDYSQISAIAQLKPETRVHVQGQLISAHQTRTSKQNIPVYEGLIDDGTGTIRVVWYGMKYLSNMLSKGDRLALFGTVQMEYLGLTLVNPHFKKMDFGRDVPGEIQPVYRRVSGLASEKIEDWIQILLNEMPEEEWVPDEVVEFFKRETGCWLSLKQALKMLHSPTTSQVLEEVRCRMNPYLRRLILEELLIFFIQSEQIKQKIEMDGYPVFPPPLQALKAWETTLPFLFTQDQSETLNSLCLNLTQAQRIFSLLQGDVGCGKTVVAFALALLFGKSGYQVAFLCPTTVLARQHFISAQKLLGQTGLRLALLSSELERKEQITVLDQLQIGEVDLVLGTHRLLQSDVFFKELGLIVIDEQHRFGVQQRLQLLKKGKRPHLLSLTATPIPRSLAHSVYGGFEVLQIRQKPEGRSEVHTILKKARNRASVIPFMTQKLNEGGQIFWVFPFIEGDDPEKQEKSVEFMFSQISQDFFPNYKVAMVHGRLEKAEIQKIMQEFRNGVTQILFATTVIEVGVDVANATIMAIEGGQHFGLSQLHQLRGRVGRSNKRGFCFLFLEEPVTRDTLERARFFETCHDGFELAEYDLKNRGAGELFGNRQTGQSTFKFADLWLDRHIYERMREELPNLLKPNSNEHLQEIQSLLFP